MQLDPEAIASGSNCMSVRKESNDGGGIQDERSECLSPSRGQRSYERSELEKAGRFSLGTQVVDIFLYI